MLKYVHSESLDARFGFIAQREKHSRSDSSEVRSQSELTYGCNREVPCSMQRSEHGVSISYLLFHS